MKKLVRILKTGAAVGALMAALPAMATTQTVTVPTNTTQTISSPIANGSSATTLDLTGGGTLQLTNQGNSYSGGTQVFGNSTLQVGTDTELGAASGRLTLGTGAGAGTLDLTPSTAPVSSTRPITIGSTGGTFVTGPYAWTLGGAVSGGGPLTITGGGTLDLTNTGNTYTGVTTITGNSTLQVGADGDLGASSALILGGAAGSGTLDLTPSTTTVSSGKAISLGGTGGFIVSSPEAWDFSGIVSGVGSLTVESATGSPGTISLSGTNTYTGGTNVIDGSTLSISRDNNLGATSGTLTLGDASTSGTLSLTNSSAVSTTRSVVLGAGGGIIDSGSASWTFTSPITGAGSLGIGGNGTIILDGVNSYSGGTDITAGTLEIGDASSPGASVAGDVVLAGGTLSGRGSVFGLVENTGGTMHPGAGGSGALTIGSYLQGAGGDLDISLTPSGAVPLIVTGNATLGGALSLDALTALHGGTYQLLTAGSITGAFSQQPALLSIGFDQTVALDNAGTAVDLILTQRTSIPENPSLFRALANSAIDDAQTGTQSVLSHLTDARSSGVVDNLISQDSSGYDWDDCSGCTPYGGWVQPFGSFGTTSGTSAAPGYNGNDAGFIAGYDTPLGEDDNGDKRFVAGIAMAFSRTSVDESGGASGTISTPRLIGYGSWWFGRFAIDGSVGAGYASFSSTRPIQQTGSSASASYDGAQLTASLQGSRTFDIKSFALTPAIGAQFARQSMPSFAETGAGAYDLDGLSTASNSLRPFVAATLAKRFQVGVDRATGIEPQIRVAYAQEELNSPGVSVDPTNDDYTFHYPGVTPSRGRASVNMGVTLETSYNLNVFTDAGLVEAGNTHGAQFDVGARYRF